MKNEGIVRNLPKYLRVNRNYNENIESIYVILLRNESIYF